MKKTFAIALTAATLLFCSSFTNLNRTAKRVTVIKEQAQRTYSVAHFYTALNNITQHHGKINITGTSCQVFDQDNKSELFLITALNGWDKLVTGTPKSMGELNVIYKGKRLTVAPAITAHAGFCKLQFTNFKGGTAGEALNLLVIINWAQ